MSRTSVHANADALADAVASALVERLASLQEDPEHLVELALTGGTIAERIYEQVAALEADSPRVDWTRIQFWWGDERYVPADSSDRNDRAVGLSLLDVVGVDPARVHHMPASDDVHEDVAAAAAAYGEEVRTQGTGDFDLVLLGVGPDGHVASLFPGFPQLAVTDEIALPVTGSPKPPPERITLTFPALDRTREVWFLVSGEGKADAVARALAPTGSVDETPARGITCPDATWWLDSPAASHLP